MSQAVQLIKYQPPLVREQFYADEENAIRGERLFAACFKGVELVGEVTAQKTFRVFAGIIFGNPGSEPGKIVASYWADFHLVDIREEIVENDVGAGPSWHQGAVAEQQRVRELQARGIIRRERPRFQPFMFRGRIDPISRFYVPNHQRELFFATPEASACELRWSHCKDQKAAKDQLEAQLKKARELEAQGKELQPANSAEALRQQADPDILQLI